MNYSEKNYWWIVLGLALILLLPGLGRTSLWIFDEARNAECAREMFERNDWIVPTFNGELRAIKPPLHYYFMFGGFKLFGISEWGARFFSAIFGVLTILITYFFIRRYSSARHALISCLVLLTSTHFLFQFRMSVPDPYLIFFNVLAIFSGFAYFQEKQDRWLWICAIAMGLGTLAKGPVAIAIPGAVILCWLIWEKRWKEIQFGKIVLAAILTMAIAVPWYLLVHGATGGAFTKGFFIDNNINRFSSPLEGHGGFFLLIPVFVVVGLLPSSVFFVESFKKNTNLYKNSFLRLCFLAIAIYVVFYSFSGTKLPNYPIPGYAFAAVLLGNYFVRLLERKKTAIYPFFILLAVNLALPVLAFIAIRNEPATKGYENLALFLLVLVTGTLASIVFVHKRKHTRALITLFATYTVFNLIFLHILYPAIYQNNPLTKTRDMLNKFDKVVGYKIFQPSFTFYLPERVKVFKDIDSLRHYLEHNKALILSRTAYMDELKELPLRTVAKEHDIFELPTTLLVTNQ
ncbi:MAG: phospholipid carrier-dependent glycosyltransferase [Terrimonas sp.]|nr:phospholipid carrier-dependent glycosyltransferase [Terrimonas sp.]